MLALHEVAALDGPVATHAVRRSPWWHQVVEAAPSLDGQAPGLADALGRLDAEVGAVELPFGRWHGDWVAWNMAEAPDGLYVWDWEYSRAGRPFGFDLLHFFFQDAFVARSQPLLSAFADAATRAATGLLRLGLDADEQSALRRLHRLEIRLRAENAVQRGAEPDPGVRDLDIFTLLAHV